MSAVDGLVPLSGLHEFITSSSNHHVNHPHHYTQQSQQPQHVSSLTNN